MLDPFYYLIFTFVGYGSCCSWENASILNAPLSFEQVLKLFKAPLLKQCAIYYCCLGMRPKFLVQDSLGINYIDRFMIFDSFMSVASSRPETQHKGTFERSPKPLSSFPGGDLDHGPDRKQGFHPDLAKWSHL